MLEFRCSKAKRLMKAVQEQGIAYSVAMAALKKRDIKVNGKRVTENVELAAGDFVEIFGIKSFRDVQQMDSAQNSAVDTGYGKFTVIYEDERMLVINKGKGLAVVGENSLTTHVQRQFGSHIFPCHRLDTNTTGLVLFAKGQEMLRYLTEQFERHNVVKKYECIVCGIPKKQSAELIAYLFKDRRLGRVFVTNKSQTGSMEIKTKYRIKAIDREHELSLLEVELVTGRTHQIRAHLAAIGYPILGDGKYGRGEWNRRFGISDQLLCACYLGLKLKDNSGHIQQLLEWKIPSNFDTLFKLQLLK